MKKECEHKNTADTPFLGDCTPIGYKKMGMPPYIMDGRYQFKSKSNTRKRLEKLDKDFKF